MHLLVDTLRCEYSRLCLCWTTYKKKDFCWGTVQNHSISVYNG